MKLQLPDVTLVVADNVCQGLTQLAVLDCVNAVDFGGVVIACDRVLNIPGAEHIEIDFNSLADADLFRWSWHKYVKTSHLLVIEWDSWVIDPSRWNTKWLELDYIGAPWPWHSHLSVGNGGFSLRSRDLLKYIDRRQDQFPNRVHEDDVLCRFHRPVLERLGFKWAENHDAIRFAFERTPPVSSFGFHGIWNWKHVIDDPNTLAQRLALCPEYVKAKPEWQEAIAA